MMLFHPKSNNDVHESVRNSSFLSQFLAPMMILLATSTSSPTVSSSSWSSAAPFTHPSSFRSLCVEFPDSIRNVTAPVPSVFGITDIVAAVENHDDTAFDFFVVALEVPAPVDAAMNPLLRCYSVTDCTRAAAAAASAAAATAAPYASLDDAPILDQVLVGVIVDGVRLCRTVHGLLATVGERLPTLTREYTAGFRSVLSRLHRFHQYRLRVVRHNFRVLRYRFRALCQFLYRAVLCSCLTIVMSAMVVLAASLFFDKPGMVVSPAWWSGAFLLCCVYNWFHFGYFRTFVVLLPIVFVALSHCHKLCKPMTDDIIKMWNTY